MNETIKEGDYVEYVGRPNEKFLVYQNDMITNYPFKIILHGIKITFDEKGFFIDGDTRPIVKKTTPPKKKVVKEFDVTLFYNTYGKSVCIYNEAKAKLLIEVEE